MSSVNPNDLLSAYFDREGTPSEETVAKSVVEGSPEAAREIREYGRLSRLLQRLPRVAAPPEFAAAVMQRAERESLIPLDSVASRPVAKPVGVAGFLRRQWMAVVASSISLVAGLLIAVMIWPRGFDAPRSRPISTDFAAVPRDELRRESPASPDLRTAPKAAPAVNAPMLAKDGVSALAARQSQSKPREAALMLPANLKTAKVGDVIEALQQDGQQVAVVRLTVVNQVEGLDGVQSLLVRNTSRTLQNVDEIKRLRQQFSGGKSAEVPNSAILQAPGDLICVYVEGSREEMLGVLSDLQNESHFPAAELTNTISVTALEEYARHAVSTQNGQRTAAAGDAAKGAVAQTPAKPTGSQMAVSLPAATVNKILSAGQPSARGWGQPSSMPQAQQSPAPLFAASPKLDSEKLEADKQTAPKASQPGRNQSKALVAGRKAPAPAGSRAGGSLSDRWQKESQQVAGDQKSFQIFFVLTDQSQSPAAPAASDAPKSAGAPPKPTTAAQAAPAKQTTPSEAPAKPAAPNSGP
jgi:hypothetical protein